MKKIVLLATRRAVVVAFIVLILPLTAHAGFFSKLNSALQKLQPSSATHTNATTSATPATPANSTVATATPTKSAAVAPAIAGADDGKIPEPPNWGTPEGTEAILKVTPKLGAGDFYLGMPADEGLAKIKSLGLVIDPHENYYFKIRQIPGQTINGGVKAVVKEALTGLMPADPKKTQEQITLNFTMYPNTPVVSSIFRTLHITDESKAPTIGNTLAALRKKYGPETDSYRHMCEFYWVFDYQGHPLSKAQYDKLKKISGGGLLSSSSSSLDYMGASGPSDQARKILGGYQVDPQDYHSVRSAVNYSLIVVKARIESHKAPATVQFGKISDEAWDTIMSAPMSDLTVTVWDAALDYSATTVSHNLAVHNAEIEKQKEQKAAQQNAVPDL